VRASTEFYALAIEREDLTVPQAGFDGEKQQCVVSPSNPLAGVGRLDECIAFMLGEELDGAAFVAFPWNSKDTLA